MINSNHEQLTNAERRLALEDRGVEQKPALPRQPPSRRRGGWVCEMVTSIATLLSAFAVLAGSYAQVLIYAAVAGAAAWACQGPALARRAVAGKAATPASTAGSATPAGSIHNRIQRRRRW